MGEICSLIQVHQYACCSFQYLSFSYPYNKWNFNHRKTLFKKLNANIMTDKCGLQFIQRCKTAASNDCDFLRWLDNVISSHKQTQTHNNPPKPPRGDKWCYQKASSPARGPNMWWHSHWQSKLKLFRFKKGFSYIISMTKIQWWNDDVMALFPSTSPIKVCVILCVCGGLAEACSAVSAYWLVRSGSNTVEVFPSPRTGTENAHTH